MLLLRKTSLARVICDCMDDVDKIQPFVFLQVISILARFELKTILAIYKLQVFDICRSIIQISITLVKAWIFSQTQSWTQGVPALTQQYPKYHFKEVMNSTSPQVLIEFSFKMLYHFQLNLAAWKEEPLQPQQHSGQDLLLGNFEVHHCVT